MAQGTLPGLITVRFWGTRGSIAKPGASTARYGGNTSCVEVRTDAGTRVIIDCGTGSHGLGQEILKQGPSRGHILISHPHWDHIQGLPFFAPLFVAGSHWHIYGPKGLSNSIRQTLAGQMEHTYFPITLEQLAATIEFHDLVEEVFTLEDLQVSTRYLNHPALTLGYRLEKSGASVVYACDHEPNVIEAASGDSEITGQDARHVEFLRGADLVIHDSQYTAREYPEKIGWGHSTVEYVVQVCQLAGAARVALTHHDPLRDDAAVDGLVEDMQRRAALNPPSLEVIGAAEGLEIELSGREGAGKQRPRRREEPPPDLRGPMRPILLHLEAGEARDRLVEAARAAGLRDPVIIPPDQTLPNVWADQYSVVLAEHRPPEQDGLELARRIVRTQATSAVKTPVILLSAGGHETTQEDGVPTEWLLTPFSDAFARAKIRAWNMRVACRWVRAQAPPGEEERLKALRELAVLDTPPEERFDRITRITAATFNVPIALVSLVDRERQWFKSCLGLGSQETPRDLSFCAHVIEKRSAMIVPDTLLDDRFADNPLVLNDPRVRFYAGAPLIVPGGQCVGTLCMVDTRPRNLSAADLAVLNDLRDLVLDEFTRQPAA